MALEFNEKLSRLRVPDREKDMTEEEYQAFNQVYENTKKSWGFPHNFTKVLPLNPKHYLGHLALNKALFDPENGYISQADKEMIGLVVSSANGCCYCLTGHADFLRGYTGDPVWVDKMTYNYRAAELTKKQRAICDYAYFVTTRPREIDEFLVEDLRKAGFNDNEILEIAYVTGYFNYTNRWVSTIEPRLHDGHYSHNR